MRKAPRERFAICRRATGGRFARFKAGETVTAQYWRPGGYLITRHPWTKRCLPLTDICAGIPKRDLELGEWIPLPKPTKP